MRLPALAALVLLVTAGSAAALTPPRPADIQRFLGVIETAEGIDVYWLRMNQLVTPVTLRYFRTTISHDGRRLGTTTVRATTTPFEQLPAAVAKTPDGVLLVFAQFAYLPFYPPPQQPNQLRIVRIEGERWIGSAASFEMPVGDLKAACGEIECVVLSINREGIHGVYVELDGTPTTRAFAVQGGWVAQAYFSAPNELFLLHSDGSVGTTATLIRRPGHVVWQRSLPLPLPSLNGAAWDGNAHLIAWTRTGLEGLTIDRNGELSQPRHLAAAEPAGSQLLLSGLVWNGSEFVFTATRMFDRAFDTVLLRFNTALVEKRPRLRLPRSISIYLLYTAEAGGRVVIGWPTPMQVVIYSNGTLIGPVDLAPPARRRRASTEQRSSSSLPAFDPERPPRHGEDASRHPHARSRG